MAPFIPTYGLRRFEEHVDDAPLMHSDPAHVFMCRFTKSAAKRMTSSGHTRRRRRYWREDLERLGVECEWRGDGEDGCVRECVCEGEQGGGENGGEDGGKDALKLALIWIDNHDIRYSLRVKRALPPHRLYEIVVSVRHDATHRMRVYTML